MVSGVTKTYVRKQNSALVKTSSGVISEKLIVSQEIQKIFKQLVDAAATKYITKNISPLKRLELIFKFHYNTPS